MHAGLAITLDPSENPRMLLQNILAAVHIIVMSV